MTHRLDHELDRTDDPQSEWEEYQFARSTLMHLIGAEQVQRIERNFPKGMGLANKIRALNIKRADFQQLPF